MSVAPPAERAYPAHLAHECALRDGRRVLIRPVREGDEEGERSFFDRLSAEARYTRFQQWAAPMSAAHIRAYTHVDYRLHMAFVALDACDGGRIVGDARYFTNPDGRSCEFGIVVADDWHHTGVASLLMEALIAAAKTQGLAAMASTVLRVNRDMLGLAAELGFSAEVVAEDPRIVRIERRL